MNIAKLKFTLDELNIRKDAYSLNGGLPNEALCINKKGIVWQVYYSEKGKKTNLKVFFSEKSACNYFLNLIKTFKE